jgi:hypothetical protein
MSFSGAVKIALLIVGAIPVVAIVAVLVWYGTIVTAYNYKWGWVEIPVHYRVTFGVEVGAVVYSGSTVVEVNYQQIPHWQVLFGPGIASLYKGQAGLLKLPDGKMVCLMPRGSFVVADRQNFSVTTIANRLLSVNGSAIGPKKEWTPIGAWNAETVAGTSEIPIDLLPPMIVLDDPANPSSAHLFDPEHPEPSLGSGARFLGAQIAVTDEPVSYGIETELPWLADPAIPQMLNGREDPFRQENHWHSLFKAYFY